MAERRNTSAFSELKRLGTYLYTYRYHYLAGLFFLLLADAAQILIPRFLGQSIDLISAGRGALRENRMLLLRIVLLAFFVATGRFGWRKFILGSSRRIEAALRKQLYEKLLTLTGSFYSRFRTGDLMARATNDLRTIRMATGMALIALIDGVFMTLVILITLFAEYGRLGLLLVIPLPLVTFLAIFMGRFIAPLFLKVQTRFAGISAHVQETVAGIRVVKTFALEQEKLGRFRQINEEYGQANTTLVRYWGTLFPLMGFIAGISVLLLLYFGGLRVIDGQMSAGDFLALLAYLGMLIWPAMGSGWFISILHRGAASMKRINEILDETPDISDAEGASPLPPSGPLVFHSLRYAYPGSPPVLRGIDIRVARGSSAGILGATGSGKTTLVHLAARLLESQQGQISIGGRDIRQIHRRALRQSLRIVPQDIFLFSGTIRENILLGRPEATEAEIEAVMEASGLQKDVPFFPEGVNTVVGERGVTLSGGQKQRIALARALIGRPEILILDDAISAVDADTEQVILNNLFSLRSGQTTLLISHRISALARCDTIMVLENGVITARGNHEELIRTSGLYRTIARLQSLDEQER